MEEETLLRERLQAITDKRRIREEIEKKRRSIEEEKLKLQYLKKKTLREQWLMDGLSSVSQEEQESLKSQTEDNHHQSRILQRDIQRIEMEIEALETQELEISQKEEVLLKQLKEVEKSPEEIIKEVHANIPPEPVQYVYTTIPDVPKSFTPRARRKSQREGEDQAADAQDKRASYTMKINVEKDLRTGESHIVSTATIATVDPNQRGVKVYEDGRKSVYAISANSSASLNEVDEMSLLEVEELLLKASEKVPEDVEFHQPVFSSPFSRPTSPQWRAYTSHRGLQKPSHSDDEPSQTTSQSSGSLQMDPKEPVEFPGRTSPASSPIPEFEEHRITPTADSGLGLGRYSPQNSRGSNSSLNLVECGEAVTMIFMGYQHAESDEEDEGIQAELVVISDEEDLDEATLSYHPLGYHSKIFKPNSATMFRSEIRPAGVWSHRRDGRDGALSSGISGRSS